MVAFVLLLFLATGVLSAGNTTSCAAKLDGVLPSQTPPNFHFSGNIRRYYIAAEEIDWNYAPSGWDNWLGIPLEYSPRAQSQSYTSPSLTWKKAVYRGYTDASFSQKSPQPAWQGVQGPTIRSEVGDMIEILFLNRLSKNYASIHSMGLSYNKDNEGSLYPNVTAEDPHPRVAAAAAVAPGDCVVYKWVVPDNAVMNNDPRQPATMHTYHSYVSFFEDMNAGLMGPQFTYQRGRMEETMRKYREFPVLFHEFDESKSNMASVNAKTLKNASSNTNLPAIFAKLRKYGNESIWRPQLTNHYGAEGFDDAPSFRGVNGYIYSNTPTFEMCVNDQVIWYIYAQGTEPHVFHLHGNPIIYNDNNSPSKSIIPGQMFALYMNAAQPGLWQLVCHVNDHLAEGMLANYYIKTENCPRSPALPPVAGHRQMS